MGIGRVIADMRVGDEGYTTPWAMRFITETLAKLNSHYAVHEVPDGTAQLLVRRTSDGYEVEITPECDDYTWRSGPDDGWCDTPVTRVIDRSSYQEQASEVSQEESTGGAVRTAPARNWTLPVVLTILGVAFLVLFAFLVFYPAPDICYGFTLGVNYPYHPIPCGLFPLGN